MIFTQKKLQQCQKKLFSTPACLRIFIYLFIFKIASSGDNNSLGRTSFCFPFLFSNKRPLSPEDPHNLVHREKLKSNSNKSLRGNEFVMNGMQHNRKIGSVILSHKNFSKYKKWIFICNYILIPPIQLGWLKLVTIGYFVRITMADM